ncbi:MAG: branched-chain amino acid aminotransferase [Bacilli bacterium]
MEKPLKFAYSKTPYRYVSYYKEGKWTKGELTTNDTITLNESACVLQYAQTCFEGLKAYKTKEGKIVCFRPDLNAERMISSCKRMKMPPIDKDEFIKACMKVIKANEDYIPEFGSGGSLYLRPFMIGTSPVLGVKPSQEFEFRIFASPVGAYFSTPVKPLNLRICDFDRAAPNGTGGIKAGLNYAMSLYAIVDAHEKGFDENVYLDSASRTYIEETGGANILFITKDNKLVTPASPSILPSITRRSIIQIARDYLHMEVEERKVNVNELDTFVECGLCGTAAVISPVKTINNHDTIISFEVNENGFGNTIEKLRNLLLNIQQENIEGPEGWVFEIK